MQTKRSTYPKVHLKCKRWIATSVYQHPIYLSPTGYTWHQLGIPTYQMWAIPVTNWVYTYQMWAIPVTNWVYLPTKCGLYLSPTGYTYLPNVGYTCHQPGIPSYQMWAIPLINWIHTGHQPGIPTSCIVITTGAGDQATHRNDDNTETSHDR